MSKTTRNTNSVEDSFNGHLTAIPKSVDGEQISQGLDYGSMNEADAKASGYINPEGMAVSLAKQDVAGSPTGAYTDIGAGRSSVVHKH